MVDPGLEEVQIVLIGKVSSRDYVLGSREESISVELRMKYEGNGDKSSLYT